MPVRTKLFNNKAFTLIELLIVIAIIAILTALITFSLTTLQKNSRDTQRKNDLQTVASVLQRFYSDNSKYPQASATGQISYYSTNCTSTGTVTNLTWGTDGISCGSPTSKTYTKQLPKDPTGTKEYCYQQGKLVLATVTVTDQNYILYSNLEGKGNISIDTNGDNIPDTFALNCNGVSYNYIVTAQD